MPVKPLGEAKRPALLYEGNNNNEDVGMHNNYDFSQIFREKELSLIFLLTLIPL